MEDVAGVGVRGEDAYLVLARGVVDAREEKRRRKTNVTMSPQTSSPQQLPQGSPSSQQAEPTQAQTLQISSHGGSRRQHYNHFLGPMQASQEQPHLLCQQPSFQSLISPSLPGRSRPLEPMDHSLHLLPESVFHMGQPSPAEQAATNAAPVIETNLLKGLVTLSSEGHTEEPEEVINVEMQSDLEIPQVENVTEPVADNKATEEADQSVAEPESAAKELVEATVSLLASEPEDATRVEKVNGHEADAKVSAAPKNPVDTPAAVPVAIVARGPLALESYNKALLEGKTCMKRLPVMFIGQDGAGKTSLKKSVTGEAFKEDEDSTNGIEVDPSYFKVSTEIWKTGEKKKEADSKSEISFESRAAAQLIVKSLKVEQNSVNASESPVVEHEIAFDPDFKKPSASPTKSLVVDNNTCQPLQEQNTGGGCGSLPVVDDSFAPSELLEETITDSAVIDTTGETVAFECKKDDNSHLFVPELPDDIATLVKQLLEEDENKENEEIFSVLWDFGGQSVYYSTHPIFLSTKAIYILVCDLSRDPHAKADSLVRKGLYKNKEDTCCNKSNVDYLDFWLSSVYSLSSPDDSCQVAAGTSETLPTRLPLVFFVCTHADKPYDRRKDPRDLALEIYGFLQTKTYREHLFSDVFVVDNTKSGSGNECSEVVRLRDKILPLAKELPQMKEEIPLKWLRYETALQLLCKKNYKWIPVTDAKQLAFDVCRIDDDLEFQTLLNFLHDQKTLIHFNGTPELERMVILDPQWLIDVFKMVITVKRYEHSDKKVVDLWHQLEETGILDENLLEHVWSSLFDKRETRESLIAIMERFSLLCPWPSNSESSKQYLVPSMLLSPPTDEVLKLLAAVQIPSLYVKFTSGRVPPGLFPRLVLQFFQWCNEEWKSKIIPQLFQNFAMFHICPEQGSETAVAFLCHSSFIEVSLCSGSKGKATADFHGSFDVTTSRTICSIVRMMLEGMRKEFFWLKNMSYEMCVRCLVCSSSGSVNYCHTHNIPGCSQDECLHFVPDAELYSCQEAFVCTRPGVQWHCSTPVRQYAPHWFGFFDEEERFSLNQEAANNGNRGSLISSEVETDEEQAQALPFAAVLQEGLLSQSCDDSRDVMVRPQEQLVLQLKQASLEHPEAGEEQGEERALALPHAVQAALLSQSTTAEVVVARLEEDLQLNQVSLKNPEPETKKMIRCLAREAKFSGRLDVVKHLREVVPAGTTGPLLHENLDVAKIPLQPMRALSVHLCGGDEWKTVVERMGLSPPEIRFLDNRSRNPFEDAVQHIRKQQYLNVGQLYDAVVDSGYPTYADLL